MIIKVRGKSLNIDDTMAEVMKKNYMDVDENSCLHYLDIYFTDESVLPHKHPDMEALFDSKSESELSGAINEMIRSEMPYMKDFTLPSEEE